MEFQSFCFVAPEELQGFFNSKNDLYHLISVDCKCAIKHLPIVNYLLPSKQKCTMYYLRDVLSGKKKALKQNKAQLFDAPKYEELSVKRVWGFAKESDKLSVYFPDYDEGALPERDYLWTIISSIMPDETKELIQSARKKRGVSKEDSQQLVKLTTDMKEEIFGVIRQKTTKGNAAYMLKQSAVLKKKRQKGKVHQTDFGVFKNSEKENPSRSFEASSSSNKYRSNEAAMEEEDKDHQ